MTTNIRNCKTLKDYDDALRHADEQAERTPDRLYHAEYPSYGLAFTITGSHVRRDGKPDETDVRATYTYLTGSKNGKTAPGSTIARIAANSRAFATIAAANDGRYQFEADGGYSLFLALRNARKQVDRRKALGKRFMTEGARHE